MTPQDLPPLPEPFKITSTIKCVACGAPYEPSRLAAPMAEPTMFPAWATPAHACRCGSVSFKGTLGEGPSPAQFTADQMRSYALAAVEAARPKWLPIAEAPKDGSPFLATGWDWGRKGTTRHYVVAQWSERRGMFQVEDDEESEPEHLTHFTALPAAPSQE